MTDRNYGRQEENPSILVAVNTLNGKKYRRDNIWTYPIKKERVDRMVI